MVICSEDRFFVFEKMFSCAVALLFILFLSPRHVLDAVIVFGHAHFALTYFYQYRAGKIKAVYLVGYMAALATFFYLAYSFSVIFTVFVAAFFLFHNFFDEFKLRHQQPRIEYLFIILPLVGMLSGWIYDYFSGGNVTIFVLMVVASVSFLLFLVKSVLTYSLTFPLFCPYMFFLLLLLGVFLIMEFTGNRPNAMEGFGFVILIHYLSWYVRLGWRYKNEGSKALNRYIGHVLLANVFFMAGYYIVVVVMESEGLLYVSFYHPFAFYVWTLLHLITTFRFLDYKSAFSFSKVSA